MHLTRIVLLLLLLLFSLPLSAQPPVSPGMLMIGNHPTFPDAEAVVLLDKADISITAEYQLMIQNKVRIHILKEAGLLYADVIIPFLKQEGRQIVTDVHARSYKLRNGEMAITELKSQDVFTVEESDGWAQVRFSIPAVEVGAILEYEYVLLDESVFSYTWYFQKPLPVLKSEVSMLHPERIAYSFFFQGAFNEKLVKLEGEHWTMNDIPAMEEEPYVPNLRDYRSKMIIQVGEYVNMNTGQVQKVIGTWEGFSKDMLSDDQLDDVFKTREDLTLLAREATGGARDTLDIIRNVYAYVQKKMYWNGEWGIFPSERVSKLLEHKEADAGEINFVLTSLLRHAGIDALPMLLSTRAHGQVIEAFPLLVQFNVLVCFVRVGSKKYVLDACDPLRPYSLPQIQELNEKGWVLSPKNSRWEPVAANTSSRSDVLVNWSFVPEGLKGDVSWTSTGYKALAIKHDLERDKAEDVLRKLLSLAVNDATVSNIRVQGASTADSSLTFTFTLTTSEEKADADQLYLNLFLEPVFEQNLFNDEDRQYPIHLNYPYVMSYSANLMLPPGYVPESLPANRRIMLDSKEIRFDVINTSEAGALIIQYQFQVKQPRYDALNYPTLKQIFDMASASRKEPVVLKRQ